MELDEKTKKKLLTAQRNEITEYHIYNKLAKSTKDPHNREILKRIADDEKKHHDFWKECTHQDVEPSKWKIWKYTIIIKIFGLMFGLKLMEAGEENAQVVYGNLPYCVEHAKNIIEDEDQHEKELLNMINEEKLKYIGSIVLGLNDGLVELTGALAGFTLALSIPGLIAMLGLITGISGAMSMGASAYLSTKSESEENGKSPFKSAIYTGGAYILTVFLLVLPYLITRFIFPFPQYYGIISFVCLIFTIVFGVLVVLVFTYYISMVQDLSFKKRFLEMAAISLGIAVISFFIGFALRIFFGVDI